MFVLISLNPEHGGSSMSKDTKRRTARLGRGLSSLMAGAGNAPASVAVEPETTPDSVEKQGNAEPTDNVHQLAIDAVEPNPFQPRQRFETEALQNLAESIRHDGVMQPIIVRGPVTNGKYQIIAGERRWRACQLANLETIPAIVRDLSDQDTAEWALIENIQREDLNPIEQAEAFQTLVDRYQLSHEQIASRAGINRSTVSNALRILGLQLDVRQFVLDGLLSAGQARAIAGLSDGPAQKALAVRAVRQNWSVRQVESAVRQANDGTNSTKTSDNSKKGGRTPYLADLQKQIGQQLGTKVQIRAGRKKGTGSLSIDFYSIEQFDELLSKLGVKTDT